MEDLALMVLSIVELLAKINSPQACEGGEVPSQEQLNKDCLTLMRMCEE